MRPAPPHDDLHQPLSSTKGARPLVRHRPGAPDTWPPAIEELAADRDRLGLDLEQAEAALDRVRKQHLARADAEGASNA